MLGFCTALALHKNQMVNLISSIVVMNRLEGNVPVPKELIMRTLCLHFIVFFSSVLVKAGKLESSAGSGSHQALN